MPKANLGDVEIYYVRSTPVFLYPDWWINRNLALLEAREKLTIPAFPAPEIVASRIDAIIAFDRTADLAKIKAAPGSGAAGPLLQLARRARAALSSGRGSPLAAIFTRRA
jgi:hypothetical protein